MDEKSIQILAGLGLFALGVVLGALFQRTFKGSSSKTKRLEQKLTEVQDSYTKYQTEVSAHFMETARKVQTLNNSYRDVHQQLAKGAQRLCNDDEAEDFLAISVAMNNGRGKTYNSEDKGDSNSQLPPMDYAPKETPDQAGTLSEGFGLADRDDSSQQDPASKLI